MCYNVNNILTDFENAISVGFTADVGELGYQVLRGAPVMIGDRYWALNMSRGFLELEEHDTRHRDISGIREVERDVEWSVASLRRSDPVFLVFSVRDLAWRDLTARLDS